MNEIPIDPPSKKRSTAWRVILILVVLVFLIVGFFGVPIVCFAHDQRQKRTEVIIQIIKVGIVLEIANYGKMPAPTFDSIRAALGRSSALVELSSLKAIDDQRKCFVDAWGHPLSITTGEMNSVVVMSPGKDGILGNADDLR